MVCLFIGLDGKIFFANNSAGKYFSCNKEELVGTELYPIMTDDFSKSFKGFIANLLKGESREFSFLQEQAGQFTSWKSLAFDAKEMKKPLLILLGTDVTETVALKSSMLGAQAVQKALLPTPLDVPHISLDWYYKSADDTGGDWFDLIYSARHDQLVACIADVNGHGTPAAMITGCVAGLFRGQLIPELEQTPDLDIVHFLKRLNLGLFDILQRSHKFVTLALIKLDLKSGRGSYVSCGHPCVLVFEQGKCGSLQNSNPPIGVRDEQSFVTTEFILSHDQSLFMYTDGLIENVGKHGVRMTARKLRNILKSDDDQHQKYNLIKNFTENLDVESSSHDDVAFVCLRRNQASET